MCSQTRANRQSDFQSLFPSYFCSFKTNVIQQLFIKYYHCKNKNAWSFKHLFFNKNKVVNDPSVTYILKYFYLQVPLCYISKSFMQNPSPVQLSFSVIFLIYFIFFLLIFQSSLYKVQVKLSREIQTLNLHYVVLVIQKYPCLFNCQSMYLGQNL